MQKHVQKTTQCAHTAPKQTWPTSACIQKPKMNFRLQFFKIKNWPIKKTIDQSDSCGFSAQLRVLTCMCENTD